MNGVLIGVKIIYNIMIKKGTIVVRVVGNFAKGSAIEKYNISENQSSAGTIFSTICDHASWAYYADNYSINLAGYRLATEREAYLYKLGVRHLNEIGVNGFPKYWKIERNLENYEIVNSYVDHAINFFSKRGYIGINNRNNYSSNENNIHPNAIELTTEQFKYLINYKNNNKDENSKSIIEQDRKPTRTREKGLPLGGYRRFHKGLFETKQEKATEFTKRKRRISVEVQYSRRASELS